MLRYSIIIPVYNTEAFLRECLDSVLAQDSPSEWEGILVDDGSTDSSGAICDEYAAKDARFRVIRQANAGLSAARNAGLDVAAGEFILFLDSDDLWHKDLLSSMDQISAKTDITEFGYERLYKTAVQPVEGLSMPPKTGETGEEWISRLLKAGQWPEYMVWKRMWRREFFLSHGFRFVPEYTFEEDVDFSLTTIPCAKDMKWVDRILYSNRKRSGSLLYSISPSKLYLSLSIFAKWLDRYPAAQLADNFCLDAASVSKFERDEMIEKSIRICEENRDKLLLAGSRKAKLAARLMLTFGICNGSKIYCSLGRLKHLRDRKELTANGDKDLF